MTRAYTVRFQSMLDSYGLTQHVKIPTRGPTYLMSSSNHKSTQRRSMWSHRHSDHSFIVASLNLQFNHGLPTTVVRSSTLLKDPPTDAEGLFECYDTTMITLWINTRHSLTLRFDHITTRLGTIMNAEQWSVEHVNWSVSTETRN